MTIKQIITEGITAKQSAELVRIANTFKSDVMLSAENKKVNAKSLMGVIALGLKMRKTIIISAEGADEAAAAQAVLDFLAR